MSDELDAWISNFPSSVSHPFHLRPQTLYTIDDLYDSYQPGSPESWFTTYDQRAYGWFYDANAHQPRPLTIGEAIAARIHDAAIEHAIDDFLIANPAKVIGFMGGHDTKRADPAFRQVVAMARSLRRKGFTIVTGGGPGLMEAANFGAFLAGFEDEALDEQLKVLSTSEMDKDPTPWIDSACKVRENLLGDWRKPLPDKKGESLGIPTWLYGNEPPNLFASAIGKYFYNSVREDGLVSVASGGLVFGPGSAGTVQEIFQDVTINYYTAAIPTPMVFFGKNFWHPAAFDPPIPSPGGHPKPAFPLVEKLARDRGKGGDFTKMLLLEDDPDAIVGFLEAANAQPAPEPSIAEMRLSHRLAARS